MTSDPVVLGDRYELGEVIGRGGMAEVRRARDLRLGRDVAVKQLRADLAGDPTFQARFRREAQSAAGLNAPTIVSVYDTGSRTVDGVEIPYIVMELVEGSTLRDILRDGRRILPQRALELTAGVLDALAYSHKAGIIHRDIKPANVMLTRSGQVKVMDFGIARAVADTAATMTQTAAVIGTAQYLSPEQARGETVDARSDVYSAGCLLYELLTGRPPFVGDSPVSVAYQHVRETPVAPSQLDPDDDMITPAMDAVVMRALAKDPADRYQSAGEMKEDINRILTGRDVLAPAATTVLAPDATVALPSGPPTQQTVLIQPAPPASQSTPVEAPVAEPPVWQALPPVEADPVVAARPARRGTNPFVAALLTVLLLALLGAAAWGASTLMSRPKPTAVTVAVPVTVGFTETQAKGFVTSAGLTPEVVAVNGPAETKGQVTASDPAAGTQVAPSSVVRLTVNQGPETVKVPAGLKGATVETARQILAAAGLQAKVEEAKSEPAAAKAGDVLEVSPGEGQPVAKGGTVTLSVATGQAQLPDVVRDPVDKAKEKLVGLGFGNVTVDEQYSDTVPAGYVSSQSPPPGPAAKTTPVTLTVSKGPNPNATLPQTAGQTQASAVAALQAAGFADISVVEAYSPTVPDGTVISQDPPGGAAVDKKTPITLTVSKGPSPAPTPPPVPTVTAPAPTPPPVPTPTPTPKR